MNQPQRAQRELLAALRVLRQLTKEVGGNYLASLQADLTSVEQVVREELPDRKQIAQFRAMLKQINALHVNPQKGRRRDLKQLDRRISELRDLASDL